VVSYYPEPALFVLKDFHAYLDNPTVLRKLRDLAAELPAVGKHVLFVSPQFRVPEELDRDVEVIDVPPPDLTELDGRVAEVLWAAGPVQVALTPEGRERLLQAALGLTATEARTVFAKAIVQDGVLEDADLRYVLDEKKQAVRRSGILEFYEAAEGMEA